MLPGSYTCSIKSYNKSIYWHPGHNYVIEPQLQEFMRILKNIVLWLLALVITFGIARYQLNVLGVNYLGDHGHPRSLGSGGAP